MTLSQIISATSKNAARQMAIAFAQANSYQVSDKHSEVSEAWMNAMCVIMEANENGIEADYTAAFMLGEVRETLQTWA